MMRKLLVFGTLCLALGTASCKTYCPAYNYAKLDIQEAQKVSASETTTGFAIAIK